MKARTRFVSMLIIMLVLLTGGATGIASAADEVHWTITGQTSVTFDWRGLENENFIQYGTSSRSYAGTVTASPSVPEPFSGKGPYWEAGITGLQENTLYYYSIAGGPEHTFRTPLPPGDSGFIVCAESDMGSTADHPIFSATQQMIADMAPAFVLVPGDLTHEDRNGEQAVDQHFIDVMVWSQDAAYMPIWGNHDWDGKIDYLSNYKGRFDFPNSHSEDWYWFDYGNVRFIAYPEPYGNARDDWWSSVRQIMEEAQNDPDIHFIVTFGHRPAYSSGYHDGASNVKEYLDALGDAYSKYVLNLNGHSHDYERSFPQHGVTHVTVATSGGDDLAQKGDCLWGTCSQPSWSAFRAMHLGIVKLYFGPSGIEGSFICGPAGGGENDISCTEGSVVDSFTIGKVYGIDNAPPKVTVTSPIDGTNVAGTILFSAEASDDTGMAGVQFFVDGNALSAEFTDPPYEINWDTGSVSDGSHILSATARDISGNTASSSSVEITVNNHPRITLLVDQANVNCSDSGPGTEEVPYCTIGGAASAASDGTTVMVASGDYREQVVIEHSGTEESPLVFTAAPGAAVNVGGGHQGFSLFSCNWITIQGFTVSDTQGYGIAIYNSSHVTVSGNHVTRSGQPVEGLTSKGIYLVQTNDSLVNQNTVDHNSDSGIYVAPGCAGITLAGNVVSYNARGYAQAAAGIDVRSSGNTIRGNMSHHNEDSGIQVRTGAADNLVVNNVCFENGDHGIYVQGAPNQHVIGNSVYHNTGYGINIENGSVNCTLANNLIAKNGKGNVKIHETSLQGTWMDYDLIFQTDSKATIVWGALPPFRLPDFAAETGLELHGIEADPLWIAPDQGDFNLKSGSPAIDSADSGIEGAEAVDIVSQPRVDIAEVPDSGNGPRTYDDRGAYEFQPSKPLTFTVLEDATIDFAQPTTTFGKASKLAADNDPVQNFLMKFVVSGIEAKRITSARLRLHSVNASDNGGEFWPVYDNSWSESSVTWDTAPVASNQKLASLDQVNSGSWVDVDVTEFITGDGTYSLRVTSASDNGVDYSAREEAAYASQLLVTVVTEP